MGSELKQVDLPIIHDDNYEALKQAAAYVRGHEIDGHIQVTVTMEDNQAAVRIHYFETSDAT